MPRMALRLCMRTAGEFRKIMQLRPTGIAWPRQTEIPLHKRD